MTGIERIAAERKRQIEEEGFTAKHDDQWKNGQLAMAAASYACVPDYYEWDTEDSFLDPPKIWPFDSFWWKPRRFDRIRELEKAGALVAAEIDRLLRTEDRGAEKRWTTGPVVYPWKWRYGP
jgi:hypothetical protein